MKIGRSKIVTAFFVLLAMVIMIAYNAAIEIVRHEPFVYSSPRQKLLVAELTGDPETTLESAGILFHNLARQLKLSPSYITSRYPDRWQWQADAGKEELILYHRVVPETAMDLANVTRDNSTNIYFKRSEEERIASIIHVGRYEEIPHSQRKLQQFILDNGYLIDGYYEETRIIAEFNESDPDNYETVLRYQVTRD